jgi:starch phosphorylase
VINADGAQEALYPYNEPAQLPIKFRQGTRWKWIRTRRSPFPDTRRGCAWEAKVGRTKLYLLDTNDPANQPIHRGITSELYGGGPSCGSFREVLLGIFGWRLLEALGYAPGLSSDEGTPFAVIEQARSFHAPQ